VPPRPKYDANAVAVVASIERNVQRLHPDRQGEIIAILNAITSHIEEGRGDPGILRHLTDALVAMVTLVRLDARTVTLIIRKLDTLRERVGRAHG
jgi:hypothetical protein